MNIPETAAAIDLVPLLGHAPANCSPLGPKARSPPALCKSIHIDSAEMEHVYCRKVLFSQQHCLIRILQGCGRSLFFNLARRISRMKQSSLALNTRNNGLFLSLVLL